MYISRLVIRNFRNFEYLDVSLSAGVTCIIGENNTGKTNLLHALRLAVDANLSSQFRQLREHDIHSGTDLTKADQVLVSVEFTDYKDEVKELALLGCCEVDDDLARIHYRYRPRREVRDAIEAEEREETGLSPDEDYHFELTGGGKNDPAEVAWNEDLGSSLRFGDLQAFQVEFLPALRDVSQSLRHAFESPLGRILNSSEIADEEKEALVRILENANTAIEAQPTISEAGEGIRVAFAAASGDAFAMGLKLGMSDPSFASITRSLKVLLSNASLKDFEPVRNGLGLNNILYISMLLKYFEHRVKSEKAAGQLLLIEEPEAHLHPQLQRVLYSTLAAKPFQTLLTTHSTHISSHAPLDSFISLTNDGTPATSGCVPREAASLTDREADDLNRYLDATRSTLLFARKVILIEGPAELFLIPPLVRHVMDIDLDRHGVATVPIYGTHFSVYTKLFGPRAVRKKCAVICDGDADPSDVEINEDDAVAEFSVNVKENEFVQVYECSVTFERAATIPGTLAMFVEAVRECDYPDSLQVLEEILEQFEDGSLQPDEEAEALNSARSTILKAAKRCGKARFAQIASKYVSLCTGVPGYIRTAVEWLLEDDE